MVEGRPGYSDIFLHKSSSDVVKGQRVEVPVMGQSRQDRLQMFQKDGREALRLHGPAGEAACAELRKVASVGLGV